MDKKRNTRKMQLPWWPKMNNRSQKEMKEKTPVRVAKRKKKKMDDRCCSEIPRPRPLQQKADDVCRRKMLPYPYLVSPSQHPIMHSVRCHPTDFSSSLPWRQRSFDSLPVIKRCLDVVPARRRNHTRKTRVFRCLNISCSSVGIYRCRYV